MRSGILFVLSAGVVMGIGQAGGCTSLLPMTQSKLQFQGGLRTYAVQANVPTEESGLFTFDTQGFNLGRGSISLDPDDVSLTPSSAEGGKLALQMQDGGLVLEITAWIAGPEELATVFTTGDQYGPYQVTLDENFVPVSISPSSLNLTQRTLNLLNAGQFALGVRVVSPIDGTVTIQAMSLSVGL